MKLMPSCREAQLLATESLEGTLPFTQRLGLRLHLLLCWACRAFVRGLEALPGLSKRALAPAHEPPREALDALDKALDKIRRQP